MLYELKSVIVGYGISIFSIKTYTSKRILQNILFEDYVDQPNNL